MPVPSFPQEICDIVIDAGHAEPRALATCSFVSHGWLARARTHKFHSVRLRSPAQCTRLERLLDSPLLDSASIAHCVRDLWFGVDSHDTSVGDAAFQQMWQADQRLAQLLLRFARISSLQLENVMWAEYWLPRGVADAIFAVAPGLTQLHLHRVVFEASDGVIRLLSACSSLRRLRLSYMSWTCRSRTVAAAEDAQRFSARMVLELELITMEPWSYSALFSAAALYTQPVYVSAETVEWATSERPRNVVIRNLRAAEAMDVYRRIGSPGAMGDADDVPIPMERAEAWIFPIKLVRIDISTPVLHRDYNAFANQVPRLLQKITVRDLDYDLGTFVADSFWLDIKLNSSELDDALSRLVAHRREMVVTFRVRLQYVGNLWWASAAEVVDSISTKFSQHIPKLLALQTRVGIIMSFFDPDRPLPPHSVWKEVWWTAD